jgi:hypothetical protein
MEGSSSGVPSLTSDAGLTISLPLLSRLTFLTPIQVCKRNDSLEAVDKINNFVASEARVFKDRPNDSIYGKAQDFCSWFGLPLAKLDAAIDPRSSGSLGALLIAVQETVVVPNVD